MKIYLLEPSNNQELYLYLKNEYNVVEVEKIHEAQVVIINKVYNIKLALDIVDFALNLGKEIICIKNRFAKEYYVCNYLIQNGANYI